MDQVIIDFSHYQDEALPAAADAAIKGCTTNTDIVAIKELAAVVTKTAAYNTDLAASVHGDAAATVKKNKSKDELVTAMRDLGIQVNIQTAGDRGKALKTGFPMVKIPGHHLMGDVEGFTVVTTGVAGMMDLQVGKPMTYPTHGTVFAYWDVALGPTPVDKGKWFHRQCNGHHISIGGFTPGTNYPFASAYKGLDSEPLIWSRIITKMAGD